MTANTDTEIKNFLLAKKELFLKLLEALEEEREILKSSDLDALWKMNDVKNQIASDIETKRQDMIRTLNSAGIKHGLNRDSFKLDKFIALFENQENYKEYKALENELKIIKTEVYNTQSVNRQFVEEYLGMLEELVTVIAQTGSNKAYARGKSYPARSGGLILNQEV